MSVDDLSDETWWACALAKIVALVLVAFAVVLVAAALWIKPLALQVLVALTSWLLNIWADNELTLVAMLVWCAANS